MLIKVTIIEAIKEILNETTNGLTATEIYEAILDKGLYQFGAQNPIGVVNGMLRRHCSDLDFPTASPAKYFCISGKKGKTLLFSLLKINNKAGRSRTVKVGSTSDKLPEEKIADALNEHMTQIEQQLLETIASSHPSFFEQLVVDLLLKMGYGYDKKSGFVVGGPHDNGIDGIISQDNLGLDLIYIQAKRYDAKNSIGRKEIQAFIGAMSNVQKGVFITTSYYTKEAEQFALQQQQKSIKLINGKMLAKYMIKFEVGVECVNSFSIYKLNSDYFGV